MDPLKYRRPVFVNPPFRDALHATLARHVGPENVALAERLLPLLDGSHDIADIYARCAVEGLDPALVTRAFAALDSLDSLAEAAPDASPPGLAPELARYRDQVACLEEWLKVRPDADNTARAASEAQYALGTARVVVMGLGRLGSALLEALALAGIGHLSGIRSGDGSSVEDAAAEALPARLEALNPRVSYAEIAAGQDAPGPDLGGDGPPPLLVYCPDAFHEAACEELNTVALGTGASLLVYRESPFSVELGPLIIPGRTACYTCYQLRRRAAEPKPAAEEPAAPAAASAETPALTFPVGVHLLALEIVKVLTRAAFPVSRGKLWRLGLFDGSVGTHPILKLPRCPSCGVHRRTPPRRIWEE